MAEEIYRRGTELLEADVGGELVALDAKAGRCFGFNAVATSVWRALERPKSFAELRDELLTEYEVDAEECDRDLRELLDDLSAKGLVKKGGQREQGPRAEHFR